MVTVRAITPCSIAGCPFANIDSNGTITIEGVISDFTDGYASFEVPFVPDLIQAFSIKIACWDNVNSCGNAAQIIDELDIPISFPSPGACQKSFFSVEGYNFSVEWVWTDVELSVINASASPNLCETIDILEFTLSPGVITFPGFPTLTSRIYSWQVRAGGGAWETFAFNSISFMNIGLEDVFGTGFEAYYGVPLTFRVQSINGCSPPFTTNTAGVYTFYPPPPKLSEDPDNKQSDTWVETETLEFE